MKLTPEARRDYEELRRVMMYLNSHPSVDGKFNRIEYGNLHPEHHKHPILICEGDAFLKVGNEKHPLRLARNYVGPKRSLSEDTGIYLTVEDIFRGWENVRSPLIYWGILSELKFSQSNDKLYSDGPPFELSFQPIDVSKIEEVDSFFSMAEDSIRRINRPEVRKKVEELEKILALE